MVLFLGKDKHMYVSGCQSSDDEEAVERSISTLLGTSRTTHFEYSLTLTKTCLRGLISLFNNSFVDQWHKLLKLF